MCPPYSGCSASAACPNTRRQDHAFPLPQLIFVSAVPLFEYQLHCTTRRFLRRHHTGRHIYSLQIRNPWQNQTAGTTNVQFRESMSFTGVAYRLVCKQVCWGIFLVNYLCGRVQVTMGKVIPPGRLCKKVKEKAMGRKNGSNVPCDLCLILCL